MVEVLGRHGKAAEPVRSPDQNLCRPCQGCLTALLAAVEGSTQSTALRVGPMPAGDRAATFGQLRPIATGAG